MVMLKELLRLEQYRHVKVIIMSATFDSNLFALYFEPVNDRDGIPQRGTLLHSQYIFLMKYSHCNSSHVACWRATIRNADSLSSDCTRLV